ncbi:PQQ-dependent sugar dehydrogenase [Catenovulum maritimum]|uniref:Secretion protein HlyD n=1 Tax=Catenovulum maritimum TaxID=1513271 RepID=A0A0J8JI00_9ALTE|nr:PQQ-dependent sugar dehydrogenase [Catenovulum maritimum]KMT64056.1 secretion protein HlyD [Catenovulum maritimum]
MFVYSNWLVFFALTSFSCLALAQMSKGDIKNIYQDNCASCHGKNLQGGMGGSLIDASWKHGSSDDEVSRSIKYGKPDLGMPAWQHTLSDEQIRSMVVFIREQAFLAKQHGSTNSLKPEPKIFQSKQHNFKLELIESFDETVWAVSFTNTGQMFITEKQGRLWFKPTETSDKVLIKGTPDIWLRGQGGLLDVVPHPDYDSNGWIYLSYAKQSNDGKNIGMTAVSRGKINKASWVNEQNIYTAETNLQIATGAHFGSRIVLDKGYLYFSIGDRGKKEMAQDLSKPNGKIHRLHDDGRVPLDNPFVNSPNALKTIYSYGHRNPQGLALDTQSNKIWSTEHGPRGGDEINLIKPGINYGWPKITYGINYSGTPISDKTALPGMAQPKHYWVPSIATAGVEFYRGEKFSDWKHNFLVTGMSAQELRRIVIKDENVIQDEVLIKNQGRVRDVAVSPSGDIYVAINQQNKKQGKIFKLVPVNSQL